MNKIKLHDMKIKWNYVCESTQFLILHTLGAQLFVHSYFPYNINAWGGEWGGRGWDDCEITIILLIVKGHVQCFICCVSKKDRPLASGFNQPVAQEHPHWAGLTKLVREQRASFRSRLWNFLVLVLSSQSLQSSVLCKLVGMQKIFVEVNLLKKTI